ncbi:MAG: hypothetical protein ACYTGZ_11095, partial [Planctomycetota bacterium]
VAFPRGTGRFRFHQDPQQVIGGPTAGKIDVLDNEPVQIGVYPFLNGPIQDPQNYLYEILGSGTRAVATRPSRLGDASVDSLGMFKPGLVVPEHPERIRIYEAKSRALVGVVKLKYQEVAKIDGDVTITLEPPGNDRLVFEAGLPGPHGAPWLKQGASLRLATTPTKIDGSELPKDRDGVVWSVENEKGEVVGNVYRAPLKGTSEAPITVTLVARAVIDPRVERRIALTLLP